MRSQKTALAAAVTMALAVWQQPAVAAYDYTLNDYLTLYILQNGDAYKEANGGLIEEDLNPDYLTSFTQAADYYYSITGSYLKNTAPARVQVAPIKENDDNAAASSDFITDTDSPYFGMTNLTAALYYGYFGESGSEYDKTMAEIQVDHAIYAGLGLDWYLGTMHNLTYSGDEGMQSDLASTLIHELAHAYGMASEAGTEKGKYLISLSGKFAQGLYDSTGKSINDLSHYEYSEDEDNDRGAVIAAKGTVEDESGYFIVNSTTSSVSGAYFTGTNTAEVLNGALIAWPDALDENGNPIYVAGVPVNGFEPGRGGEDEDTGDTGDTGDSGDTGDDGDDGDEGDTPKLAGTHNDEAGSGTLNYGPEFSHLELKNALMSHQSYRNYNVMMEAELAVLQDVGVPMDRRNLYGYSVYNSGSGEVTKDEDGNIISIDRRVFVNTNPYYDRTSDGQWIAGTANPTAYGTGLHVYGSYNDITQAADLLSSGLYGLGIRVDGESNVITVQSGTTVSADGQGGTGILVAYGRGHEVNVAGTVTATAADGNAVAFDFGDNNLGNAQGYRGSYIEKQGISGTPTAVIALKAQNDTDSLRDELKGALVESLNVSGTLKGGKNAIYISSNAYVQDINILSGAALSGDITSKWNFNSDLLHEDYSVEKSDLLLTALNFGIKKNGDDVTADPDFSISYDGNISGAQSLVVNFLGGTTDLGLNTASSVKAMAVTVGENATLNTASSFSLDGFDEIDGDVLEDSVYANVNFGTLTNKGTLALGGSNVSSVSVTGSYLQSSTGTLKLQFNESSNDVLSVSGNAKVSGTISLAAAQDYYAQNYSREISLTDLIAVAEGSTLSVDALNAEVEELNSPTLTSSISVSGEDENTVYTIGLSRAANAYSRYASEDSNSQAVAAVFDSIAANASSALKSTVAALDFSAKDGSAITAALDSLNPAAYGSIVNGIQSHQRFLNDMGQDRMQKELQSPGLYAYADPYVTHGRRGNGIYAVDKERNYGVIAGVDKVADAGLYGVYLNLNYRSQKADGTSSATDRSIYAGIRGSLNLNEERTLHLFGDARTGFDFIKLDRSVNLAGTSQSMDADFTAWGTALQGGIDYELRLEEFTVNFGADLSYSYLRTPGVNEHGSDLALRIEQDDFNSLKAGLGVGITLPELEFENGGAMSVKGTLRYHRELLDDAGSYKASFRNYSGSSFSQNVDFQGKDSIYTAVGADYSYEALSIGADVGGEFYQGEGRELFGRVNLSYRF